MSRDSQDKRRPTQGLRDPFINTPLQRGGDRKDESENRFNGLRTVGFIRRAVKPLKRFGGQSSPITPLKRGFNEKLASDTLGRDLIERTRLKRGVNERTWFHAPGMGLDT